MTGDLVPVAPALLDEVAGDRRDQLERIVVEAESADGVRAHEIMLQGRAISSLLSQTKAPYEEAWLAGKASVVAARRLGKILATTSNDRVLIPGHGSLRSERRLLLEELGLKREDARRLVRLANGPDAEFQRYIQDRTSIPSLGGACREVAVIERTTMSSASPRRRRGRASVRPRNPSLDEGYSLIVKALGHLSELEQGGSKRTTAVTAAIGLLYEVEDLLKPYRGGYVE